MSRIDRVTTKTGDSGNTMLGDGSSVPKDHPRVEALGTVDELNSALGFVLAQPNLPDAIQSALGPVQHDLFDLGAELAVPGTATLQAPALDRVETNAQTLNAQLPPLKEFVLPGGDLATAACHVARTVCRRAERRLITLNHHEPLRPELIRYLNRLSDLLFIVARISQQAQDLPEPQWDRNRHG